MIYLVSMTQYRNHLSEITQKLQKGDIFGISNGQNFIGWVQMATHCSEALWIASEFIPESKEEKPADLPGQQIMEFADAKV